MKCPVCGRETRWEDNEHRPFCSERCKLVDLGAWAGGSYVIPGYDYDDKPSEGGPEEEGDAGA